MLKTLCLNKDEVMLVIIYNNCKKDLQDQIIKNDLFFLSTELFEIFIQPSWIHKKKLKMFYEKRPVTISSFCSHILYQNVNN